jgi:hypothetical protein
LMMLMIMMMMMMSMICMICMKKNHKHHPAERKQLQVVANTSKTDFEIFPLFSVPPLYLVPVGCTKNLENIGSCDSGLRISPAFSTFGLFGTTATG